MASHLKISKRTIVFRMREFHDIFIRLYQVRFRFIFAVIYHSRFRSLRTCRGDPMSICASVLSCDCLRAYRSLLQSIHQHVTFAVEKLPLLFELDKEKKQGLRLFSKFITR